MSAIVIPTADYPVVLSPARFSSEEYLAMVDAGLLEGKKVELIGGVIVEMSPAGTQHTQFLILIVDLFAPLLQRYQIGIQGTLSLIQGQVYDPDFMLLKRKVGGYKHRHPQPVDVQLVIEAAASSLNRDQQFKLPAYATAGIQEYWIADLDNEQILVHRDPMGATYQSVQILKGEDQITPLVAPEFSLSVRQMFE
jgi:Uma2 family endonuclease